MLYLEVTFTDNGDVENDEPNIAYDLLRCVSKIDLNIRREVI